MQMQQTRHAYLHGFASSPLARKGLALATLWEERLGLTLERPDLNRPSFTSLTYTGALEAIDEMARDAGQARWCLIGSSMGGYLAARWAELQPERVARLALLCPGFDMRRRWRALLGVARVARWQDEGSVELPGPDGQPARLRWDLMRDLEAHPATPEVPCPTLIIHGRRDETVPIESSRSYAASRDHVTLLEVDDDHSLAASIEQIYQASARFFGLIE